MMFDTIQLQRQHDLRRIVERDLGPSPCKGTHALKWRCPFHQERVGYSLVVWADNWRCFGKCKQGGDIIAWLQQYHHLSFAEACRHLGGAPVRVRPFIPAYEPKTAFVNSDPPKLDWQQKAWKVVEQAVTTLWSLHGQVALDYLQRERHLSRDTIQQAKLGYVPGRYWHYQTLFGLTVPCGITIPWFAGHELWAVKIRRLGGDTRYTQIAGGSAGGLYNVDNLSGHTAALFLEGEFDTLLAQQESAGLCGIVTLGSAAYTLNHRWLEDLSSCQTILVAYDNDEAGRKGAARLQALTSRARLTSVPVGKDVSAFYNEGGSIQDWLEMALNAVNFARKEK